MRGAQDYASRDWSENRTGLGRLMRTHSAVSLRGASRLRTHFNLSLRGASRRGNLDEVEHTWANRRCYGVGIATLRSQ